MDDFGDFELDVAAVLAAVEEANATQRQGAASPAHSDEFDSFDDDAFNMLADDEFGAIDDDALLLATESIAPAVPSHQMQPPSVPAPRQQQPLSRFFPSNSTMASANANHPTHAVTASSSTSATITPPTDPAAAQIVFGISDAMEDPTPPPPPPLDTRSYHPLNHAALPIWIYPTNYPIRGYQFNMVRRALFENTLVSLPTGLGKTLIAAVVMYNFYRWFPNSIVIFTAPTRPLVEQQIEACFHVCGLPQSDTAIMTGTVQKDKRRQIWANHRVFFCTPQVVDNDLKSGLCPSERVSLVVVDEAHKATGGYAFVNIINTIGRVHDYFRVLALSATPGKDIDRVQEIVNNLRINHIEIRSEDSMDVQQYTFSKRIQNVVIPLDATANGMLPKLIQDFGQIFDPFLARLRGRQALRDMPMERCTPYLLRMARMEFTRSAKNVPHHIKTMVFSTFMIAEKLSRAYETLWSYGASAFMDIMDRYFAELRQTINSGKRIPADESRLLNNPALDAMLNRVRQKMAEPGFVSHPKLDTLLNLLLRHVSDHPQSRIMIFCTFRNAVSMIRDFLTPQAPLLRPIQFVGQAEDKSGGKGMNQRQQQEAIQSFKTGKVNVLIATSVGEEGLDIGEVDLIVCYDAQSSPIRMLQRMGRTGRKRQGNCVMLMTEVEEQKMRRAKGTYRMVQNAITNGRGLNLCPNGPSVLPPNYKPVLQRKHLEIGNYQRSLGSKKRGRGQKVAVVQKDGTLTPDATAGLLHEMNCTTMPQLLDKLGPQTTSSALLENALTTLPLNVNALPTKRIGHSSRTLQFVSLITKMEHHELHGTYPEYPPQAATLSDCLSQADVTSSGLILPQRRKATDSVDPSPRLVMPRRRQNDKQPEKCGDEQDSNGREDSATTCPDTEDDLDELAWVPLMKSGMMDGDSMDEGQCFDGGDYLPSVNDEEPLYSNDFHNIPGDYCSPPSHFATSDNISDLARNEFSSPDAQLTATTAPPAPPPAMDDSMEVDSFASLDDDIDLVMLEASSPQPTTRVKSEAIVDHALDDLAFASIDDELFAVLDVETAIYTFDDHVSPLWTASPVPSFATDDAASSTPWARELMPPLTSAAHVYLQHKLVAFPDSHPLRKRALRLQQPCPLSIPTSHPDSAGSFVPAIYRAVDSTLQRGCNTDNHGPCDGVDTDDVVLDTLPKANVLDTVSIHVRQPQPVQAPPRISDSDSVDMDVDDQSLLASQPIAIHCTHASNKDTPTVTSGSPRTKADRVSTIDLTCAESPPPALPFVTTDPTSPLSVSSKSQRESADDEDGSPLIIRRQFHRRSKAQQLMDSQTSESRLETSPLDARLNAISLDSNRLQLSSASTEGQADAPSQQTQRGARAFLDLEAELSGEDDDQDDDEEDDNSQPDSFIHDASSGLLAQNSSPGTPGMSMYRASLVPSNEGLQFAPGRRRPTWLDRIQMEKWTQQTDEYQEEDEDDDLDNDHTLLTTSSHHSAGHTDFEDDESDAFMSA
ncbi:P-loop containing nucleoside triphosphate hydrolase protein [Hesseltinella vesiculosa]|uniref:ATP-dependent DNA helicase n=1 Tax=Hesseltinella vesiculosa TaxID=101127 RepID=A0A1X2GQH1_9FUNG|nr:P-loop containing nucleoside triphosphate hydrolase protein [Hesseltinella vesiculosa]